MNVIVFDLDDTLFYELDYMESAFREIAGLLESVRPQEEVLQFMLEAYEGKKDVFDSLLARYKVQMNKSDLLTIYRNHTPKLCLRSEVEEMFTDFRKKEYGLGIITDGRSLTQRSKIKALGLDKWIADENVIISEEFGTSKPTPENYLYFECKYPGATFYYIGDNIRKDFIAAKKLGWITVCLLDQGKNIHKQEFECSEEYNPHYRINNLKELNAII